MKSVDGKGAASFLYSGNIWAVKDMRGYISFYYKR